MSFCDSCGAWIEDEEADEDEDERSMRLVEGSHYCDECLEEMGAGE